MGNRQSPQKHLKKPAYSRLRTFNVASSEYVQPKYIEDESPVSEDGSDSEVENPLEKYIQEAIVANRDSKNLNILNARRSRERPSQVVLNQSTNLFSQQIAIPAKEFMQCINEMQISLQAYERSRELVPSNKQIFGQNKEDIRARAEASDASRSLISFSLLNSNSMPYIETNENHRRAHFTPAKQSTVNLSYSLTEDDRGTPKHIDQRPESVSVSNVYKQIPQEKFQTFGRLTLGNTDSIPDEKVIKNLFLQRNAESRARRASCLAKMAGGDEDNDLIVFSFVKDDEDSGKKPLGQMDISLQSRRTLEVSNNEFSKRISVYRTKECKFLAAKRSKSSDFEKEATKDLKNYANTAVEKIRAEQVSSEHVELFVKFLVPNLKLNEVQDPDRLSYAPTSRKNLGFTKTLVRETIPPRCSDPSNRADQDISDSFAKSIGSKGLDSTPIRFNQEVSLIARPSYTRRYETTRIEFEELINDIQPDVKCIQDEEQPIPQVNESNPIVATRMTPVTSRQRIDTDAGTETSVKNTGNKVDKNANIQNHIIINQSLELEDYPECRDSFNPELRMKERLYSYKKSSTADTEAPRFIEKSSGRESIFSPGQRMAEPIVSDFTIAKQQINRGVESVNTLKKSANDEQPASLMKGEGDAPSQKTKQTQEKELNTLSIGDPNRITSLGIKKYIGVDEFWRSSEPHKFPPDQDSELPADNSNMMKSKELGVSPIKDLNTVESLEIEKERGSLQSMNGENRQKNKSGVLSEAAGGPNLIDSNTNPLIKVVDSLFSTGKTHSNDQEFVNPFENEHLRNSRNRFSNTPYEEDKEASRENKGSKFDETPQPFNPFEYTNPFVSNLAAPNVEDRALKQLEDTTSTASFNKKTYQIEIEVYNSGYASSDFAKGGGKLSGRFSHGVSSSSFQESHGGDTQHKESKFKSAQMTPKFPGDFRIKIENVTEKTNLMLFNPLTTGRPL